MVTCPGCGQQNPDGFRFCGACGAALTERRPPSREERKRISVVFCDLVGFTGRAESMDPEEVRALLQPYHSRVRHELERYGGTVEKFIGDAVVALFGAPVAHEDDPERAVRAALAVRDAVAGEDGGENLHVRVGVTTGEALVTLDARPEAGEGMASGDVVNTAARVQAAAPVDTVLVDAATQRATERTIEFRPHAAVAAKGKAEPVPVWEALAARARFGLDVGERTATPLVGRDLEVGTLTTALARARSEHQPQLVTLVGVPGIGKSRLVLELFRRVDAEPELIRWRQGRCLPYGAGVTLWALGEIVKAEAGVLETDSAEHAGEKLAASVRAVVAGDDADWVERHLRPLVGLEGASELTGEGRDEAFAAWRRYFEGLAEASPVVLVVEDLQWADDALLDFVDHLVDWAAGVPLLVVATARPELLSRRPGWSGGKANAVIQSLAPLTDAETASLAHAILGRAVLPIEVQRSLVENAGGNPLYAEEFARMVTERANGLDSAALPESVQGIIAARLDALESAEKALLQDAAVLGKVFWLSALEQMTGEPRWQLERRLHELERRELVRRDRQSAVAGERQYAFRHLLIREVAYGQIPRARRRDRHVSVAKWIESLSPDRSEDRADMLAYHWTAALEYAAATGQDTSEIRAPAHAALVDAGERALSLNAPASAAGFFERALALEESDELLLLYARSLYLVGDERAEAALVRARDGLARSGDAVGQAFAEAMLNYIAWLAGDTEQSNRHVARAVELVRPLPASAMKARVLAQAAGRANVAGRNEEAVTLAREALPLAEAFGLDDVRSNALTTLGDARVGLGDRGGFEDLEQALRIAVGSNSPEAGRAAHNLGVSWFLAGDIARMQELLLQALQHDERFGNRPMRRFTEGTLVSVAFLVGEWDQAWREGDKFLAASDLAPHYLDSHVRSHRAAIRFARDDVEGALDDLDRALHAAGSDPQAQGPPLAFASWIYLELEHPQAEETARRLVALRIGGGLEPVGIALIAQLDLPPEIDIRLRARLAEPSSSRWVTAARASRDGRFADAAELYGEMPLRPVEALARMRTAEQLARQGRRAEADEQLQRALAFWRSVRATRYITQAERLLAATA